MCAAASGRRDTCKGRPTASSAGSSAMASWRQRRASRLRGEGKLGRDCEFGRRMGAQGGRLCELASRRWRWPSARPTCSLLAVVCLLQVLNSSCDSSSSSSSTQSESESQSQNSSSSLRAQKMEVIITHQFAIRPNESGAARWGKFGGRRVALRWPEAPVCGGSGS